MAADARRERERRGHPLVSGRRRQLVARRRWVDATLDDAQVPATHGPAFAVAAGVTCITPTELTRWRWLAAGHVIVGAGKTAVDTALWLLEQGVDPDTITWIRPREARLLNRANVRPTVAFAHRTLEALTVELEVARDATSLPDLFARLEAAQLLIGGRCTSSQASSDPATAASTEI